MNSEDKRREDIEKRANAVTTNPTENKSLNKKVEDGEVDPAKVDPAQVNPQELASFPKQQKNEDPDIEAESENNLVNQKKSPVRDKRNITRTGPSASPNDGFM